jgi:O-methyltransferase
VGHGEDAPAPRDDDRRGSPFVQPPGLVGEPVDWEDGSMGRGVLAGRDRQVGHAAAQIVSQRVASVLARRARRQAARIGLADLDESVHRIIRTVEPYTVASHERIAALCASVDYVIDHDVPGALVECGLWRGGSVMAVLLRLGQRGVRDRDVIGFDTFAGMTEPTAEDVDYKGRRAGRRPRVVEALSSAMNSVAGREWPTQAGVSRDEVFALLASTGYDPARIRLVPGPVEDTLPAHAPETLALLRLDTDWYVSTRHELEHLYPRLVVGGVLIVDDYGHYQGARKAVDEYLEGHRILLQRIDYTGRLAIKQQAR